MFRNKKINSIDESLLILVDGCSYLYRAYFAFQDLTNKYGESIGAIYGVLNMLKNLLVRYHPNYVAIVFDTKSKTFRKKLFSKYKSHRKPMPNDLGKQIQPLVKIITSIGIRSISIDGVEADDVIGTLAISAKKENCNVLISTSDKDMSQLVSSKIYIVDTMFNLILNPEKVESKFGVPPTFIVDYLALMGDSIDNIPGVPGIGKKTARFLLKNIGGINDLYNRINEIQNLNFRGAKSIYYKLKEYQDLAFLSYELAKIKTDVDCGISYDLLKIEKTVIEFFVFFCRYKFENIINNLKLKEIENIFAIH